MEKIYNYTGRERREGVGDDIDKVRVTNKKWEERGRMKVSEASRGGKYLTRHPHRRHPLCPPLQKHMFDVLRPNYRI